MLDNSLFQCDFCLAEQRVPGSEVGRWRGALAQVRRSLPEPRDICSLVSTAALGSGGGWREGTGLWLGLL